MAEKTMPDKEDSEDNSDDNLKIIIDSPRKRKPPPTPTESERLIIESMEDELEKKLEEKAAKTNLNAVHVKRIIKHVVTNEHVLHLIRNVENVSTGPDGPSFMFEPKLTRSKAKELNAVPLVPLNSVPWVAPKPLSEVQALFPDDLQEDSSGDEYVPGMEEKEGDIEGEKEDDEGEKDDDEGDKEDESEDDRDSSIFSDPPSVEPPTPPPPPPSWNDFGTQTSWTEDGIFKIPPLPMEKEELTDEATIALRTRSKLCLSSTPLEVIEEAFVPPDIPTDTHEMDCDNEDWMNFLVQTFTCPLDEIAKAPEVEEEELDPEYNVLADEEVDKPDKEELRVDRAVKVSRKEVNDLIAELYEFCTNEQAYLDSIKDNNGEGNMCSVDTLTSTNGFETAQSITTISENESTVVEHTDSSEMMKVVLKEENPVITPLQISLLEQHLRQHVQLLTQNFLLTYQHPELHHHSVQMKEYLLNLQFLAADKHKSVFNTINLENAIKLVTHWEKVLNSGTDDVKRMRRHIERVTCESLHSKQVGNQYIPTFPPMILETISKSDVFLYPSLLPKIPFKSPKYFTGKLSFFTDSEVQLIALGLEQFMPLAQEECTRVWKKRKSIQISSSYIQDYMLPNKTYLEIYRKIIQSDSTRVAYNPIRHYFQFNKAPCFIQYVVPLEELKVLPPCQRRPDELPHQWKNYIYRTNLTYPTTPVTTFVISSYPEIGIDSLPKPNNFEKALFPKGPISSSTPLCPRKRVERLKRYSRKGQLLKQFEKQDPISKFVRCLSRPSPINKVLNIFPFDFDDSMNFSSNNVLDTLGCTKKMISEKFKVESDKHKNVSLEDQTLEFSVHSSSNEIITVSNTNILDTSSNDPAIEQTSVTQGTEQNTSLSKNMPSLFTPLKTISHNVGMQNKTEKAANTVKRNIGLDISGVISSSLPTPVSKTEISFDSIFKESISENKEDSTPKDNKDDINALLIASSTVKPATKKEPSGAEKKRAKLKKEFLANLSISTPEDREVEKQKNEMFALAYYDKMRETLEIDAYHKIMQILNEYEEGDAIDLYHKIEAILRPKYEDLADEFLLFLREREAAAVGRLVPWIRMNNRSKFLRKLEIYFKDQPSQLKKIYQCLTELTQTVGISMEKIKSTLVPMFKGNAVLTDLFLQNFLDEPPPPSLLEGSYETIDINKEMSRTEDEEPFETIVVPDVEDKYGGNMCICNCHEIEDAEFKSRFRHCARCGTKFINGKVFMQTGRGLRPARVSFLSDRNIDHQARLADKSLKMYTGRKKRSDSSPSKASTSSMKDNLDEETDEDGDKKKKPKRKPPQKRTKKQKVADSTKDVQKKTGTNRARNLNKEFKASNPRKRTNSVKKTVQNAKTESEEPVEKELKGNVETESEQMETELEEQNETELEEHNETELEEHNETELEEQAGVGMGDEIYSKPGTNKGQLKRLHEESYEEAEQSAAGESSSEVKPGSPEQHTAESESEFCEESSQDNCEFDSNSSTPSTPKSYAEVLEQNSSWNREEDKIILEVFQKENDKDHAFRAIANQLTNRSVDEIKYRFDTLMELLMKTVDDHRD